MSTSLERAKRAVYATFIVNGFAYASWASRIPQIKERLALRPGTLGLVLLCGAVGSLASMPATALLVARLGEAKNVAIMAVIAGAGLLVMAVGYALGGPFVVAGGLLLVGFGNGSWDVSMNVEAAEVERRLARSVMSRFHAGFSVGTVGGAGLAALATALHVPVTAHLAAVGILVMAGMPFVVRGFLPSPPRGKTRDAKQSALGAWRDRRTVLIGVFVLCMAFTEGTGNDWLGLAAIEGYHQSTTVGALTLACFLAAMTTGRWFGPRFLDRHGRVAVLRGCGALAFVGLVLVVFGGAYPVMLLGVLCWGLGASLGFPTGVSAAADDPAAATARVSVATTIAYLAFLAGPPLVGFVGDHTGVLRSLCVAAALLVVAMLLTGVTAPRSSPAGGARG
ncbi:MAG: transporter [Labilithrix sp.]|nr:transporter [Labilithrix sp.]